MQYARVGWHISRCSTAHLQACRLPRPEAACQNQAMRRKRFLTVILPAVVAVMAIDAAAAPPAIVFVLVDDMGYADLGCQGATDIRTPHADRLAREGVRFTDFYANAPVCTPTRCGFITGRWQQRVGLEWAFGFTAEAFRRSGSDWIRETDMHGLGLPTDVPTLPEMLRGRGWATGCFGKWHLGFRDEFNPIRRGFDTYFGELLGHADYYNHAYYDGTYALRDGLEPVTVEGYFTDLVNARAVEFVRRQADRPFFLYVPQLAVHCPWQPPGRPQPSVTRDTMYDGTRRDYAAMLERVDHGLGMILAELERQGRLDDTLVVLSSDNGGERLSDNRPLAHKKSTLWEGGIRVPCLMRWPRRLPQGVVTGQPAITMDLSATFAALAGAKPPADRPFDGIDLVPILAGEAEPMERTFCWRIDRPGRRQKAVRHGDWKYLQDGNVELLFDVRSDLGERDDRYRDHPEVMADLRRRLAVWEAEIDAERPSLLVK
jgi:arylsulfatase A